MPYTLSHTALVLPFSRLLARWGVLSAMVIGAMVPDFGVFSPWRLGRFETHSLSALITFCLPIGLLTYWVFQFLIKPAMAQILPDGSYLRWRAFAEPEPVSSVRQWLIASGGILVGAMSHLIVDGFTHDGGRGVRLFPALDEPLFDIGRHHVIATRLFQDLGSAVGLVVVFAIVWRGWRRPATAALSDRLLSATERHCWIAAYLGVTVILSVALFFSAEDAYDPALHHLIALLYDSAVAVLRGLAAAVLGVSLLLTIRLRKLR